MFRNIRVSSLSVLEEKKQAWRKLYASALIDNSNEIVATRERVGRLFDKDGLYGAGHCPSTS